MAGKVHSAVQRIFLASETFIPNTSLQKPFTEIPLHPKYIQAQLFHRNIKIISLENKCILEKTENWFWDYWKQHVSIQQCFYISRQQCTIYSNSCFLEKVLKLHWALLAANWWEVAKQTKYLFLRLIKRSLYNPGSVTKLPFLKIKFSLKSYMQCHDLNTVSGNLHCVSKKQ